MPSKNRAAATLGKEDIQVCLNGKTKKEGPHQAKDKYLHWHLLESEAGSAGLRGWRTKDPYNFPIPPGLGTKLMGREGRKKKGVTLGLRLATAAWLPGGHSFLLRNRAWGCCLLPRMQYIPEMAPHSQERSPALWVLPSDGLLSPGAAWDTEYLMYHFGVQFN